MSFSHAKASGLATEPGIPAAHERIGLLMNRTHTGTNLVLNKIALAL
jgi:hypothetical protein